MSAEENDLVLLRTCGSNLEATVLRSVLEVHVIRCHFQAEHHRTLFALPIIEARLLVPAHQAQEADRVLRESELLQQQGVAVDQLLGESELVHQRTGGYRDLYPLPAPAPQAEGAPLWRPVHTSLMIVLVLLVVAIAAFLRITG